MFEGIIDGIDCEDGIVIDYRNGSISDRSSIWRGSMSSAGFRIFEGSGVSNLG